MSVLFSFLLIVCIIALVIGLINPNLVVRWGPPEKRNKKSVLKYYGIGILLLFILTGVFAESNTDSKEASSQTPNNTIEETVDIDKSAATAIDSSIEALGDIDSLTLENSEVVKSIRADYDLLDSEQQSYVTNLAVLTTAEDKITELQKEADQEAAAQAQRLTEQLAAAQAEAEAAAAAQEKAELETAQDQNNYTVYITKTGSKYHRDGCQYLRQSKIAIKKSEAVNEGYTPCSKCNP